MTYSIIPKNIIIPNSTLLVAENSYRILQSNNIFINGKNIFCDEFTDSNGTNNTLNTGLTTAVYDSVGDNYSLKAAIGTEGSPANTTSASGVSNITKTITALVSGIITQVNHRAASATAGTITIKKNGVDVASKPFNVGSGGDFTINFIESDFSDYLSATDTVQIITNCTSGTVYRTVADSFTGSYTSSVSQFNHYGNGSEYVYTRIDIKTSAIIVIDSNTITLNNKENNLCVFGDVEIPTGSNILYDISDGTNNIIDCKLNELINIESLNTGTAKIFFKLTGTAINNPKLYGFSAVVIRN